MWKCGLRLCRPMCGRAVPFRLELMESGAMPQLRGVAPGMIRVLPPVGRSRHRTSGGTAANRSFHTRSIATGFNLRYTNRSMRALNTTTTG